MASFSQRIPLRLVFLGAPGVGKGTYATKLAKTWRVPHISTGDMIREEIKAKSTLGTEFQSYSNAGKLVPDALVIEIAKKRLSQHDCSSGWILDGFPRTIQQAEQLKTFAEPSLCINFFLPDSILVQKLSARRVCVDCGANYNIADIRNEIYDMPPLLPKPSDCDRCKGNPNLYQREDDSEEVVKKRLFVYKDETEHLIKFYSTQGILLNFSVKKGLNDLPEIERILGKHLNME
ncbi:adenylate kinase [Cardiosporidium cionae]|uniref:Adenylate kinase n=1 Tax=Cardiosporidium cionae TaxID=476202 RepID=A0ABQ7J8P3_9APIC|nr:adenylate kinase [Cardiosporidium cionae]|eukprot:KAF8820339.1 adenylate kinase [Cardiosporidium cionae]